MKTLKHLPARLLAVRSRPPSKNSEVRKLWPTPSCLFAVSHGVEIVPPVPLVGPLTVAQATSLVPPLCVLQSPPSATGVVPSEPFAPPFQR
jgi:hypothetical protein